MEDVQQKNEPNCAKSIKYNLNRRGKKCLRFRNLDISLTAKHIQVFHIKLVSLVFRTALCHVC